MKIEPTGEERFLGLFSRRVPFFCVSGLVPFPFQAHAYMEYGGGRRIAACVDLCYSSLAFPAEVLMYKLRERRSSGLEHQ